MHNPMLKFRKWIFYRKYRKLLKAARPGTAKEVTLGKGSLMSVEVYDVLDNNQMNKLNVVSPGSIKKV